jgi:hypothetical protein
MGGMEGAGEFENVCHVLEQWRHGTYRKDIHTIVDSHDSAFLCIPAGTPSIGKGATSAGANLARMWADRNFSAKHSTAPPAIMPPIRIIYILKG